MESPMSTNALALVFVALLAAGCTTAQGQQTPPHLTQADTRHGCALGVGGGAVSAEDTPEGIALSFTSMDKAEEMRERVNDAAAQHGPGARMGRGHDRRHAEGGDHGLQMMQMPPAHSAAEDIEGGARIRFVPVDAADKEGLRTKLRERAASMNAQSCK
jgi:hypothetical protein